MDALGTGNVCSACGRGGPGIDHLCGWGGGGVDCVRGRCGVDVDWACGRSCRGVDCLYVRGGGEVDSACDKSGRGVDRLSGGGGGGVDCACNGGGGGASPIAEGAYSGNVGSRGSLQSSSCSVKSIGDKKQLVPIFHSRRMSDKYLIILTCSYQVVSSSLVLVLVDLVPFFLPSYYTLLPQYLLLKENKKITHLSSSFLNRPSSLVYHISL